MKILSVLAFVALMLASGATDAKAQDTQDRLASLPGAPAAAPVQPSASDDAPYPASLLAAIGLSRLEVDGIRHAVRGQIRALAARDSDTAFSHLTPVIQDYFADPAAFEKSLLKNAWPMLAVKTFAFADIGREATDAVQKVVLTDTQDNRWMATFKLQRQPDGRWAIQGCFVGPLKDRPV